MAFLSLTTLVTIAAVNAQNAPPYTTHFLDQRLDHFNPQNSAVFKQRYLMYNGSFDASKNLIFFYAGNEGPIDGFYNNTGLMYALLCISMHCHSPATYIPLFTLHIYLNSFPLIRFDIAAGKYGDALSGALILFAEHRYYGKTHPFGDKSFTNENLRYLTMENAIADYANFMTVCVYIGNCSLHNQSCIAIGI